MQDAGGVENWVVRHNLSNSFLRTSRPIFAEFVGSLFHVFHMDEGFYEWTLYQVLGYELWTGQKNPKPHQRIDGSWPPPSTNPISVWCFFGLLPARLATFRTRKPPTPHGTTPEQKSHTKGYASPVRAQYPQGNKTAKPGRCKWRIGATTR
ncbi:hypothetical protein N7470_000742 [Penicillium chermesinum]|nr:hypothetical protein N7470_000742 [Penicillium chermesinum]